MLFFYNFITLKKYNDYIIIGSVRFYKKYEVYYMDNIIKKIIEIDQSATLKIEKEKKNKDDILKKSSEESNSIKEKYKSLLESNIDQIKKDQDKHILKNSEIIKNDFNIKTNHLDTLFLKKEKEWTTTIYKNIVLQVFKND